MLAIGLCAALLIIAGCPDTAAGKALHRLLVEAPARQLSRLTRGRLGIALVLVAVSVAVLAFFKDEGAILLAQGLPESMALLASADTAALLDLAAVAVLMGAAARLRDVSAAIRSRLSGAGRILKRAAGAPRHRRAPRRRPAAPKQSDDSDSWAFA